MQCVWMGTCYGSGRQCWLRYPVYGENRCEEPSFLPSVRPSFFLGYFLLSACDDVDPAASLPPSPHTHTLSLSLFSSLATSVTLALPHEHFCKQKNEASCWQSAKEIAKASNVIRASSDDVSPSPACVT